MKNFYGSRVEDEAIYRASRGETEALNIRLTKKTIEQLDSYAKVLNMSRAAVLEVFLQIFIRYSANVRRERQVRQ